MGIEIPDLSGEEFRERLLRSFHGVLPPGAVERLYAHYRELRRWNSRVALVGSGVASQVVERLFGESLAALQLIDGAAAVVLDVGSGAGFPGLVIAAARPELRVVLVEPRQRKWAFLRAVAARAALSCECLNARVAAALPSGIPESVDRVTVRALRLGIDEMRALSARLGPDGSMLIWASAERELPAGFVERRAIALGAGRGRIREVIVEGSAGAE